MSDLFWFFFVGAAAFVRASSTGTGASTLADLL